MWPRPPGSFIAILAHYALKRSLPALLLAFGIAGPATAADRGNTNTSDGAFALYDLPTGYGNTGIGYDALRYNTGAARSRCRSTEAD